MVLDNDDARWLVGDLPDPAPSRSPSQGVRRLAVASLPRTSTSSRLGDDVLGITDEPIEAFLDDQPAARRAQLVDEAADAVALDEDPPTEPAEPEPPRRPVKKTRGRASVPSWDEIMFGPGE